MKMDFSLMDMLNNLELENPPESSIVSDEEEIYKGLITWCIPKSDVERNFESYTESNNFSIGSSSYCRDFHFTLYPSGKTKPLKTVTIDIHFNQKLPENAHVQGILSFIGNKGEVFKSIQFEGDSVKVISLESFEKTVNLKRYLSEDSLVIQCSMKMIVSTVHSVADGNECFVKKPRNFDLFKESLLTKKCFSDVKFRVQGGEVDAHKVFLANKGKNFRILLNGAPESENYFKLKDMKLETFEHIMHYIYTEDMPILDFKLASELYLAADSYGIQDLKNICCSYLGGNVTAKTVLVVLALAEKSKDDSLKKCCFDFIKKQDTDTLVKESMTAL